MIDLTAPATEQIAWLSSGKVSSEELLEAYIQRHEQVNPPINAIVATALESARATAKEIDQRRARGEKIGMLQGLPMTIKDSYDVDGLPAVCGNPSFVKRDPKVVDADIVKLLKSADAVIWGKTNTPLFAGDIQTYNKVYGVTNNPYDHSRTPGGSSGGAAAALTSYLTPLEVGSDVGGSLRIPAHNCGLVTLKPTYGQVSLKGHVPPSPGVEAAPPDLAVAGPIARTVDDIELLLSVIAPDLKTAAPLESLAGLKFARWDEPSFVLGRDSAQAIDDVERVCRQSNAIATTDKPEFEADQLIEIYQRLLVPIITAELPRVAHIIFKVLSPFAKMLAKKGKISLANTIVSANQNEAASTKTLQERSMLKDACETFFKNHDVLIAPVTSVPAIPHNTKKSMYGRTVDVDSETVDYTTQFQWISLATVCHLPSVVIPVKTSSAGLPIGIQLIGKEGDDRRLLSIARLLTKKLAKTSE